MPSSVHVARSATQPAAAAVKDESLEPSGTQAPARSLTSADVVRVLGQLVELRSLPGAFKSDYGSEFVAKVVQTWLEVRRGG